MCTLLSFVGSLHKCYDIDECKAEKSPCDSNAKCINTIGSFSCVCNAPYWTGNGVLPKKCGPTLANKCVTSVNKCDKKTQYCKDIGKGGIKCVCKSEMINIAMFLLSINSQRDVS